MAWRPYENLIDGELDNRVPGKVTGWMHFFRHRKSPLRVSFDLEGDFHEDIRGGVIRLSNADPSDRNAKRDERGSYVDGLAPVQAGTAGDITAGLPLGTWTEALSKRLMAKHEFVWDELGIAGSERERKRREIVSAHRAHIVAGDSYYAYVPYPYIEWYSENGRVVLELDHSQVQIVHPAAGKPKTPADMHRDEKKRAEAFGFFMTEMVKSLSDENRDKGGDGDVTGIVVG